jgi:predicted RNA methylase
MKLKQLESHLSQIQPFASPKIAFEQYPTSAHIASLMMYSAQEAFEDIESCSISDLGIGCGVLTIASCLLNSGFNRGFDIDADALTQTQENLSHFDLEESVDLVRTNVSDLVDLPEDQCPPIDLSRCRSDTVIMNPPFGTKTQKGIDMVFLKAATEMAEHSIYTLHKSSTRDVCFPDSHFTLLFKLDAHM